ncbi:uncharacterized protein Bfra_012386 [Botrytis fragariae]|uniref:Uncharacterized protein n=1 Tax=Botrytis fragariae TaxID=1964551 RepID=A0A8H6AJK2_9HELO|nr:uncharacterized protein Bfra_012386 [Botrytis fragariae]KAF5868475.1 hypothetical protein Bfra_012386 [Botrytis fragariae]
MFKVKGSLIHHKNNNNQHSLNLVCAAASHRSELKICIHYSKVLLATLSSFSSLKASTSPTLQLPSNQHLNRFDKHTTWKIFLIPCAYKHLSNIFFSRRPIFRFDLLPAISVPNPSSSNDSSADLSQNGNLNPTFQNDQRAPTPQAFGLGRMLNPLPQLYPVQQHYQGPAAFSQRNYQVYDPLHFQSNYGTNPGNVPSYQDPEIPQYGRLNQGGNPLQQFGMSPQINGNLGHQVSPDTQGYRQYNALMQPSSPIPQVYTRRNNAFRSGVPVPSSRRGRPQYNSPLRPTVADAYSSHRGTHPTPLSDQSSLATPVNNRLSQKVENSSVQWTSQPTSFGSRVPQSTPAGKSDSSGSATPENDDIAIQRKPAMVPKKYHLLAEHLMPGCIVWLSNYEDGHEPIICVQNHECNDKVKDKDGRNHPVMILRINQRRGSNIVGDVILDVALMTTLSGMPLDKYVNKLRTLGPDPSTQWYLKETMPLSWVPQQTLQVKGDKLDAVRKHEQNQESQHHAELNQRGNTLLFLSRGSMQRRSYMRVHHIYAVPIKQLQACSRYAKLAHMVRLDECGYRRVMEVLNLVPEPWESSIERSVAAAPQRLGNLRDEEMAQFNAIQLAESQARRDEAVMQQGLNVAQQSPLGNASSVETEGREFC